MATCTTVSLDALALQLPYRWQKTAPERIVLSQPMGGCGGGPMVRDFTWREVIPNAVDDGRYCENTRQGRGDCADTARVISLREDHALG